MAVSWGREAPRRRAAAALCLAAAVTAVAPERAALAAEGGVEGFEARIVSPLGRSYRVASGYGVRRQPLTGATRLHAGVDLAVSRRTVVRSVAAGVIVVAEFRRGYGNLVKVLHPGGYETRYAHLDRIVVEPGKRVRTGQPIGSVGLTGSTTGPHLHFEFRYKGAPMNPAPLLRRAVAGAGS